MAARTCCVTLWLLVLVIGLGTAGEVRGQARRPVLVEGKTQLFLRVLTRPQSAIYMNKGGGQVAQANVPAFRPFYVYTLPDSADREVQQGWYEVGSDDRGTVLGWMRAEDLFEWKQTLCLGYSLPVGRNPVLFFKDKAALDAQVAARPDQQAAKAQALYAAIRSRQIPPDFPVVSMEPHNAIDSDNQFYLLPILAYEPHEFENHREGRLLKVASVVPSGPEARVPSLLATNPGYVRAATTTPQEVDGATLARMQMDVVWVFDTTVSTQPYIDSTLAAAEKASQTLASEGKTVGASIRFGIWGYRCSPRHTPGIEYGTRNFTPSLLPMDAFRRVLSGVKAATADTGDWEEDVFTGLRDAIAHTPWRKGAIRCLILVGDAPGHEPGHPKNASDLGEEQIRSLANAEKIFTFSMYIDDPRARRYLEKGKKQFSTVSTNPGTDKPATVAVGSSDAQGQIRETLRLTTLMIEQLRSTSRGALPPVMTAPQQDAVGQTLRAAIVEWIGSTQGTAPPRDVTGWVADKDLAQPAIPSLDTKVLVTKRQLSALTEALLQIVANAEKGTSQAADFFGQIQNTVGWELRNPDRLSLSVEELSRRKATAELLEGLPYESRVMLYSPEDWQNNYKADDQDAFLNDLRCKIAYYQQLDASPGLWIQVNSTDDPNDWVHALDFTQLP